MTADLQEKLGRLRKQATDSLEEIRSNTDEARAAELNERHDAIMAEFDQVEASIAREERTRAALKRAEEAEERARQERIPSENGSASGSDAGNVPNYRQAFHAYIRSQGQLGAMRPEERAALERGYKPVSLSEERAQTTAATAGGYTIPEEMLPEIVRSMKAFGPMYDGDFTREIVTAGGNPMPFPTVNDTAVTAGSHTEGATLTDDGGKDVTFGEKQLDAYAFDTEWLRVSKELADDSAFAMESLLASLLGERLGRIANLQLTTGTGSSAPHGIVTASALGKTAAAVAAITHDEVLDLEHSVDPAYRSAPGVGYMFNDATLLALRKLKDGDGNYLWQQGNVQAGIPNTLNGRPYYINQDMASLATGQKVMLFGDFKKYFVRKVGTPLIGAIQDKDFWPGFGIAGYIRFDGELADTAAVKHLITA